MNGCMCLDLSFFPCKVNTAKKIFALAVQRCSDDTLIEFNNELSKMREDLENKYTADRILKRDYKREIKEVKRLIELLDKNINILHEQIKLKRWGLYESL